jgi:predicted Zn-dependent peptidase
MEPLRAIGATDWNGTTWFDRTNFFQTVPTSALDQALYMESDRMGHLLGALNQERLDNQRGVVQNEKRQGDNQPYGLWSTRSSRRCSRRPSVPAFDHRFDGRPRPRQPRGPARLAPRQLRPEQRRARARGDVDLPTAKALVQKYFGDIPRGAATRRRRPTCRRCPRASTARCTTACPTRACTALDRAGPARRVRADLDVAATVLGGLASSRLDNALVRGDESAVAVTAATSPSIASACSRSAST